MYRSDEYLQVHGDQVECVLTLIGEIDAAAAHAVSRMSVTAICTSRAPVISVNLRSVTFMDASGLNLLVQLRNTASVAGKILRLDRAPSRVARLIALGGLSTAFPLPAEC